VSVSVCGEREGGGKGGIRQQVRGVGVSRTFCTSLQLQVRPQGVELLLVLDPKFLCEEGGGVKGQGSSRSSEPYHTLA
jgi:hypothetical protein